MAAILRRRHARRRPLARRQKYGYHTDAERLAAGWQYGPVRDLENKTSPYLVPWQKLSKIVQEWDRDPFLGMPNVLEPLALKIVQLECNVE